MSSLNEYESLNLDSQSGSQDMTVQILPPFALKNIPYKATNFNDDHIPFKSITDSPEDQALRQLCGKNFECPASPLNQSVSDDDESLDQ